ncbi:hypothetical protein N7281_04570 [Rickettsia hoogstraalii]|uniref:hypothetical protein n=1 Tax=Rickettsia hoogstraalii TaxID=467174 RepID=UPI00224E3663|nr:hypothetical protein [Rickettsia hoogstraalii]MCX4084122.1 hypothetical protein [Rickettsia hoogstraalii]
MFRDNILDVANQGKYFNFLQVVSDKALSSKPWVELFKDKLSYFAKSKNKDSA